MIEEDSVRFAHSGPSQRFLRGLRPLVSVGSLPLPVSAGGHASAIATILPPEIWYKNNREGYTCFPLIRKMVFTYPDERPEGDSIKMFRLPLVAQHDNVGRLLGL